LFLRLSGGASTLVIESREIASWISRPKSPAPEQPWESSVHGEEQLETLPKVNECMI
jgi:hypothetical protein